MNKCYYCNTTEDLRPYGPDHSMVCFECAMSTPEREAATAANFKTQLEGCGDVAILDGSSVGPYPASKDET
jgi:hypothetical protein